MSLVRLQCPACSSIVKVSDEIVARHPVVRCAKCQGLVTVATSRFVEPAEDADEAEFKPKKKKKKRQQSSVPVGMIVGVVVGLLVLAGVGVGIYFLVDHFSASGPEKTIKKAISMLQRAVKIVEDVKTPEDFTKMMEEVTDMKKEIQRLARENMANNTKIDEETAKRLQNKYLPEMMELQGRLENSIVKLSLNPTLAQVFQAQAGRMGTLFGGFGGLDLSGLNSGPMHDPGPMAGRGNFGSNGPKFSPPAQNTNSGNPVQDPDLSMFENALLTKETMASSIPGMLDGIHDSESGEAAMHTLDALLSTIKSHDQQIKRYEQTLDGRKINRNTSVSQNALRSLKKIASEISVHMARIEKLNDSANIHSRLARQLTEVGLYEGNASTVAANDRANNSTANPFEPANPGSKPNTPGKPDGNNPFEPAPSGSNKKPVDNSAMNDALDSTLGKLTSTEFFRRRDGLREITSAKVDEARKKEVLDALIALAEDSDFHEKNDVLKAYKKWAKSQEDKERFGSCAEALLKDTWAKKDALRYYGENKVTSAGKEVARLLKDNFERKDAAEALIAMGSEVEKDVIPYLGDLDSQVRHMAIEVLARIGTKTCIPDLQRLLNDRAVGLAAKQAMQVINARKK